MYKATVIVLLAVVSACLAIDRQSPFIKVDETALITDQDVIDSVNNDPSSTWIAGSNDRLDGLTVKDFKRLLGVKMPMELPPVKKIDVPKALPKTFDSRTNWPGCIGNILDQGHCGSCWAFGAIESLEDRLCIFSQGKINVSLSEQFLVSCDETDDGCDGGQPLNAWQFLQSEGAPLSSCYPYAMGSCHHPGCSEWNTPSCNATCQDGSSLNATRYYADSAYSIDSEPDQIAAEIIKNGPVEVTMAVYADFANYKSGIYQHKTGSLLGYHAIKLIGWGETNNVEYWLVQNSWNESWGEKGLFQIRRGTDECGIEDGAVAGLPKVK